MDWSKVVGLVKTAAPLLGTCIGGPAGTAAGALASGAISLVASAFGVEESDNPEAIYNAIQADPDAIIKLKQIELNNKTELERIALQRDQASLADIQNARMREIEMAKATGKKDINLYVLAWLIIAGFFSLVILLMFIDMPEDSNGVIFLLFGALAAGFGQVLQYFFGTTKSSGDKTAIMALKK